VETGTGVPHVFSSSLGSQRRRGYIEETRHAAASLDMNEIAAEKQYEFAFLGMPLKLRGATGAPMPSYAVPLRA
jgi:hypothetical protein